MWTISKKFEFDYGHRVWSQELDRAASGMTENKCRHLHGHRGVVEVSISGDQLDEKGMVTDFNNLNWLKRYIDDTIDHKTILDVEDPMLEQFLSEADIDFLETDVEAGFFSKVLQSDQEKNTIKGEYLSSFVFMKGVPTSENLAKVFADIVGDKIAQLKSQNDIWLNQITFWETPKSKSVYEPIREL